MLCFVLISVITMIKAVVSGSASLRSREPYKRTVLWGLPVQYITLRTVDQVCSGCFTLFHRQSRLMTVLYHQDNAEHPRHTGECGLLNVPYFSIPGGDHCSSDRNALCDLGSFLIANIGVGTGKASLSQVIPLIQLLKNPQRK